MQASRLQFQQTPSKVVAKIDALLDCHNEALTDRVLNERRHSDVEHRKLFNRSAIAWSMPSCASEPRLQSRDLRWIY